MQPAADQAPANASPLRVHRRGVLAAFSTLAIAIAACARARSATPDLQPLAAEGGPRDFLAVEFVRDAHVTGLERAVIVSACQWHVSATGALYGDHWGWCEDFRILPRTSPGYLLLTTEFTGEMSGAYSQLLLLPPLPATVDAFGRLLQIVETGGRLLVERGGLGGELRLRSPLALGTERTMVEPPVDTGHFEPGFDKPVPADVTYRIVSYGRLDSRRISGRG